MLFLQRQGRTSSKNIAIYTVFKRTLPKHRVLRCFFNKGLKMHRKYHGFLHVITSSSQSKPAKNSGIYSVLTRQHAKKTRCFETIFYNFSAHAPPFKKRSFFTLLLAPLIRTQGGAKSGQIAKLHLNSSFCLSQSLPQSCNTKNWGRLFGPKNAVNYGVEEQKSRKTRRAGKIRVATRNSKRG